MNTITMSIISDSRKLLEAQSFSPPVATPVASATAGDIVFPVTMLTLTCVLTLLGYLSFYVGRHTVETIPTSFTAPQDGGQPPESNVERGVVHCLPIKFYNKAEASENNNDCSICLDEFRDGDNIKSIPQCGHMYHPRCVDTWLSMKSTCPMCRSNQTGPLN